MGYVTEVVNVQTPWLKPGDCGHPTTYLAYGHRDPDCRAAWAACFLWMRNQKKAERRLVNGVWIAQWGLKCPEFGPVPHGTATAYDYWGCRGNACLDAYREKQRYWRARRRQGWR